MAPARHAFVLGVLLILAIAGVPQPARAWGTAGHRMVCALAWDELKPEVETRVGRILGVRAGTEFADRCTHGEVSPADLMSLPAGARDLDLERDCPPADSCPVREIERALGELKSGQGDMADAVLRLAHHVGEVHQPLSVGYAPDRNGLGIPATFQNRRTDMHAIWHEELVAVPKPPRPLDSGFDLRLITNYLDRSRWTLSPPLAWAQESYWIMRTPATGYVGNPGGLAFDEVYVAQNKVTAMEQLEKAGIRLAHLLNQALGDQDGSAPGPSHPPN